MPSNLEAAFDALANARSSAILAGGTVLMPGVNTKVSSLDTLVSIRRLGLSGIQVEGHRATVGATTTLDEFGGDPRLSVLGDVIESIASPPIRNMATVAGNLFAAQPNGDLAVAFLALDAEVTIASRTGARTAPVAEIFARGVEHGEIVTTVAFDLPTSDTWFYAKAMRRKMNSAAVVSVAAVVTVADGLVRTARIALGAVAPRPVRALSVEAALIGRPLDVASVSAAAALAARDTDPFTDAYASAWYRARVLPVHIRRALIGA
ncbi:MAG TPA: FAD binding domain-containing protein [Roseiarcus sp.]